MPKPPANQSARSPVDASCSVCVDGLSARTTLYATTAGTQTPRVPQTSRQYQCEYHRMIHSVRKAAEPPPELNYSDQSLRHLVRPGRLTE